MTSAARKAAVEIVCRSVFSGRPLTADDVEAVAECIQRHIDADARPACEIQPSKPWPRSAPPKPTLPPNIYHCSCGYEWYVGDPSRCHCGPIARWFRRSRERESARKGVGPWVRT